MLIRPHRILRIIIILLFLQANNQNVIKICRAQSVILINKHKMAHLFYIGCNRMSFLLVHKQTWTLPSQTDWSENNHLGCLLIAAMFALDRMSLFALSITSHYNGQQQRGIRKFSCTLAISVYLNIVRKTCIYLFSVIAKHMHACILSFQQLYS